MKKILFIVGLGLLFFAVGCTQREVVPAGLESVEIKLRSGVRGAISAKAPISAGVKFTAQVFGWEHTGAVVQTSPAQWESTSQVLVMSADAEMILNPVRTYNGLQNTTLCAWYPVGSFLNGVVSFDNPTAELDVMSSQTLTGTRVNPITSSLVFEHQTTQLRFEVLGRDWPTNESIVSVTLKNVGVPIELDVTTGSVKAKANSNLLLPGVIDLVPGETLVSLGRPVMLVPIAGNTFFVDVVTSARTYTDVAITTNQTDFTKGRSYTATLTFSGATGISVGSTVGDWQAGESLGEDVD